MNYTFDPKNPRVVLAKNKKRYRHPSTIALLIILFIIFLGGGLTLLIMKSALGWLFLGFSAPFLMMLYYIKNAFTSIPPAQNPTDITDLLSEDLLTRLTPSTTPVELATILPKTSSGSFLMARFGLPTNIFLEIASHLPPALEPIFEKAIKIRETTHSQAVTPAILAVAMLESIPRYTDFLATQTLKPEDLYTGIEWYDHLLGRIEEGKRPVRRGGIARDFTFGYTPTLERFATNLSDRYFGARTSLQQADHQAILDQIVKIFSENGRQNVALIGNYGTGRSTIVGTFASLLMDADAKIPTSLKFRQIYSLDVPSIISAAKDQAELEYLLIRIFNETYSAKNIILCLDHAELFFEEGPGSIDITNFLAPILEAGRIRMILIMDQQNFLEISARNAKLANSLSKITVEPSDKAETMQVLMGHAPLLEASRKVFYTYKSLTEAYRLSEKYVRDVAMPGRALLLLEAAANYPEGQLITADSVQTAVETSYGVKVKVATSTEDRDRLLNLENLIHERMVDQKEAVSAVSNALRRAAAGVKNQNRPIGTFLFLGPTGVGKTELAKSLSSVYFGGEDDIIRLDMNEFVAASDVARLIEDASGDPFSLTALVTKRPFSVILLDEIEKAHPAVLTTLLQVLDEGVLRDSKNQEVSFRDAIIIATSNAGANEIREKITSGENISDFKDALIDKLISSGEFKPEFLNRFDEICLFKPLAKSDLFAVLDLILASVNKTLEPQSISVTLDDEAKAILVEKGYDPKMGARPMRRIVQKTVENIVAAAILSGHATPGSTLHISASEINIS